MLNCRRLSRGAAKPAFGVLQRFNGDGYHRRRACRLQQLGMRRRITVRSAPLEVVPEEGEPGRDEEGSQGERDQNRELIQEGIAW